MGNSWEFSVYFQGAHLVGLENKVSPVGILTVG